MKKLLGRKKIAIPLIVSLGLLILVAAGIWLIPGGPRRVVKAIVRRLPIPTLTPLPTLTPTPRSTSTVFPTWTPAPLTSAEVTLIGAGDLVKCGDPITTNGILSLFQRFPEAAIFAAGDSSNDSGTLEQYQECVAPAWRSIKARVHPAVGNHDYYTPGAEGYYDYFRAAAGDPNRGYYSYNLGAWHILVLNSNCHEVGGCKVGSPQETWLKADLAAYPTQCTLAYWHEPLFVTGLKGSVGLRPFWEDLYAAGAEIVVNGHEHHYERYAPQDPQGLLDPNRGMIEFIVGTGGAPLETPLGDPRVNSQVIIPQVHGVLKFNLRPGSYDWEFIPIDEQAPTDSGSGLCHE